jgi:hypothetical protein
MHSPSTSLVRRSCFAPHCSFTFQHFYLDDGEQTAEYTKMYVYTLGPYAFSWVCNCYRHYTLILESSLL